MNLNRCSLCMLTVVFCFFFFFLLKVCPCSFQSWYAKENFSLSIALCFECTVACAGSGLCFYTRILKVNYICLLLLTNYVRKKKKISQPTLPKHKLILQLLFLFTAGPSYDFLCFPLIAGKPSPKLVS